MSFIERLASVIGSTVLFLFISCFDFLLPLPPQVHRYYRTSGHTINQAVEEGVSGAAKNKHIRSAVKTTVSTGVKTAFAADNK